MEALYQDKQFTKRFLVAEHIASDLTQYHQGPSTGEPITLSNLQKVIRKPYTSGVVQNLAIGDQLDKTTHDLQTVVNDHNVGYIMDITTRFHGMNVEKLKVIQETVPGLQILYGYTPKMNYVASTQQVDNLVEKLKNEIEFDMKNGVIKILPSFIGELIITDLNDHYQRTLLDVCYAFQQSTLHPVSKQMCPIFINLGPNYETLIPQLIEMFKHTQGQGIVYILPHDLIDNNLQVHPLIETLLTHTQSYLCVTLYNHNVQARQAESSNMEPFKAFHLLSYFISKGHIGRILISTGVAFKTHLTPYGGMGYSAIFDELLNKYFSGNQDLITQLTQVNPLNLLLWRQKVEEAPQKVLLTWECRWCMVRYPENHDKFEKNDNNYCQMKCLTAHRVAGFK